jgi:hypothetical protein
VTTYLNPPDEIVEDAIDDDRLLEQIAESYDHGPESDPDPLKVPLPEPVSVPQALSALTTLRGVC